MTTAETAPDLLRLSPFVPERSLRFNHVLVGGEDPLTEADTPDAFARPLRLTAWTPPVGLDAVHVEVERISHDLAEWRPETQTTLLVRPSLVADPRLAEIRHREAGRAGKP